MKDQKNFTEGKILGPLLQFALPVLFALFLQSLYGAVDLMIVGKFAEPADVSGVSTGSQIMMTLTNLVSSLSMGMTVFLGQKIGEKKAAEGGKIVANGIILFFIIGIVLTIFISACSGLLASIMNAPEEAYDMTVSYVRICGTGAIIIISYNLIG
ncbi:MAG: MATE family efflux transporter, partial [Butyrivibrio sp.]|nr:MATE family efflux transporter [Butyrivibrio sp.]